ncbi:hypothetical protein A4D02_14800 [Niastella koreensis]|uniref:Uncharacterized protein n=2 Tax=Niastella koreensis TaxID=354356 RepID=G8T857_NIAKG|nr:hypothetical protein Niako_1639 [Niastella koreensis GR20-10]OQP40195.1 hypothetical protein A4D02_14800 [Niastella koreensis]
MIIACLNKAGGICHGRIIKTNTSFTQNVNAGFGNRGYVFPKGVDYPALFTNPVLQYGLALIYWDKH